MTSPDNSPALSQRRQQEELPAELSSLLLPWFERHRRELPWREDKNPYHVWVSEIMLQQTRIETVKGYYRRFLERLPEVGALSEVPEEELLKLWEGLGYYSRAKNLQKAARVIVEQGGFPQTFEGWKQLPGVGEYTAGAVASLCFGERVPAVDGNVLRIAARLTGSRKNVLLPDVKRQFTARLKEILPDEAGAFNEAMMELGETVCLPGVPLCGDCPLRRVCTAFREGCPQELPVREKQQTRRREEKTVLLLQAGQRFAIEKRPEKGLLSGLYGFPCLEGTLTPNEAAVYLDGQGAPVLSVAPAGHRKHLFTHVQWEMEGVHAVLAEEWGAFVWAQPEEIEALYPLPTAFRGFQRLLKGFTGP